MARLLSSRAIRLRTIYSGLGRKNFDRDAEWQRLRHLGDAGVGDSNTPVADRGTELGRCIRAVNAEATVAAGEVEHNLGVSRKTEGEWAVRSVGSALRLDEVRGVEGAGRRRFVGSADTDRLLLDYTSGVADRQLPSGKVDVDPVAVLIGVYLTGFDPSGCASRAYGDVDIHPSTFGSDHREDDDTGEFGSNGKGVLGLLVFVRLVVHLDRGAKLAVRHSCHRRDTSNRARVDGLRDNRLAGLFRGLGSRVCWHRRANQNESNQSGKCKPHGA